MFVCRECGSASPDGARFCADCGAALTAPGTAREARKTVTVLFCDVAGSTGVGEQLDPESLRHVMARYFDATRAVIERHGGTVEKFVGDAVMAVFGVPRVREDDAPRAVRAAAEMREALATLNEELGRDWGVRLRVRTGVNTGEVVSGGGDTLVTGDAVVVAKRLEEAAAPGEILLGDLTRRLVEPLAILEPVEPLQAKGKAEPLPAWRLSAVVARTGTVPRELETPMVGRERELRQLLEAFDRAVRDRACVLFSIFGVPGIGKSRLAGELATAVADRATVLTGDCRPYGEATTFAPLARALEELGGADVLAAHAETGELFWALRRFLESAAQERPLVLIIDDVQWAGAGFLDVVDYLVDWIRDAPVLLVCLARPELLDVRPAWGRMNAQAVVLEPLSEAEAEELVVGLAGAAGINDSTRVRIVDAAEGNPLFVEQIVAMAAEVGDVVIPATIQALLQARLDRLSRWERAVVERAALVGRDFGRAAVATLSPELDEVALQQALHSLVRKELIHPLRAASGEETYRFRHVLIRDTAYDAMSKRARSDLHARFAQAVEEDELAGHHLERAFRLRSELGPLDDGGRALAERAADRLSAAGRRALAGGDAGGAADLLGRAAALRAGDGELLVELGTALRETGDLARAAATLAEAAAAGDERVAAHAAIEEALLRFYVDADAAASDAIAVAERAQDVFTRAGDDLGLARAWDFLAYVHLFEGRIAQMEGALERALAHAERAGDRRRIARILTMVGYAGLVGPTPVDRAIRRCDTIRTRALGQPTLQAVGAVTLANLYAMRGRFEAARALWSEGETALEDLGQTVSLASMRSYAAAIEMLDGKPEAAEDQLRRALAAFESIGETGTLSTVAALLADALVAQGKLDEADRYAELSATMAAARDATSQVAWRTARARIRARQGQDDEAVQLAGEAVDLAAGTDYLNLQADALTSLAEALRAVGRLDEAAEAVREAVRLYESKGNVAAAARAVALAAPMGAPL